MAEINRKSVLMECLSIMREELRICSTNYNGLAPKKGMEEAWAQCRKKVSILEDLTQAMDSEPVRRVIANWQMDVMQHGPTALKLDAEITIPMDDEPSPRKLKLREFQCPICGANLTIYTKNTNVLHRYMEE